MLGLLEKGQSSWWWVGVVGAEGQGQRGCAEGVPCSPCVAHLPPAAPIGTSLRIQRLGRVLRSARLCRCVSGNSQPCVCTAWYELQTPGLPLRSSLVGLAGETLAFSSGISEASARLQC